MYSKQLSDFSQEVCKLACIRNDYIENTYILTQSSNPSPTPYMYTQDILDSWQFRQVGTEQWYPAQVPGNVITDLLANDLIEDPFQRAQASKLFWVEQADWEYKTLFVYDDKWMKYDAIELVFDGLDTYADVYLNDHHILSADNMHQSWRVDVKEKIIPDDFELIIKKEETNELRIVFHSVVKQSIDDYKKQGCILPASEAEPAPRLSVYNRKAAYHFGSDYTPRLMGCGIWKRVHICAWSQARIDNIQYSLRELESRYVSMTARFEVWASKNLYALFRIKSQDDGLPTVMEPANLEPGLNIIELNFEVLHPRLWWPKCMGEPNMYEMRGEMTIDARVAQYVEDKIGLRKIELVDDSRGAGAHFEINGKPLFVKGAHWMPPDYFPNRKTADDYHHLLTHALEANINMLRVWGGGIYERDVFYDLCDEMGILVWHDFMFSKGIYPASKKMQKRIKGEVKDQLKRLRNHPCLALWCGNEETEVQWKTGEWQERYGYTPTIRDKAWSDYQKIFYDLLPHLIGKYDTGRIYIPSYPQVEEAGQPFVRFIGFPSAPRPSTLASYTSVSDWNLDSEVMQFHQIGKYQATTADSTHHLIAQHLKTHYPDCPNIQWWVYLSQVYQANYIKNEIEKIRRASPASMGVFYGHLHNNWPATSEAGIDYRGKWKALHYYLREALAEILIAPYLDEDKFMIPIISDLEEVLNASLALSLTNFSGETIRTESREIEINPQSIHEYYEGNISEWLGEKSPDAHMLLIRLHGNNETIAQNIFYFTDTKSLQLKKPDLSTTFIHTGDTYRIELLSDTLMKNVYLSLKSARGFFSDNFFDLLPNVPYRVYLSPVGPELNLGEEMEVRSMVDLMG